jgi:hypothetical protein
LTTGFQTSNSNSKTTSNLKQKHTSKLKPWTSTISSI